jgi:hypothetical protein
MTEEWATVRERGRVPIMMRFLWLFFKFLFGFEVFERDAGMMKKCEQK